MVDGLLTTVLEAIAKLTATGTQATTERLLFGRHRWPRIAVGHGELLKGLPRPGLRFASCRQYDSSRAPCAIRVRGWPYSVDQDRAGLDGIQECCFRPGEPVLHVFWLSAASLVRRRTPGRLAPSAFAASSIARWARAGIASASVALAESELASSSRIRASSFETSVERGARSLVSLRMRLRAVASRRCHGELPSTATIAESKAARVVASALVIFCRRRVVSVDRTGATGSTSASSSRFDRIASSCALASSASSSPLACRARA